jgi:hypothetical protein
VTVPDGEVEELVVELVDDDERVEVEESVIDERVDVEVVDDELGRHWKYHWLSTVHTVPAIQTVSPCIQKDGQGTKEQTSQIGGGAGLTV